VSRPYQPINLSTYQPIKFGTDGWRALVAEEFTLPNVRAVTQGVAEYLLEHPDKARKNSVVVGYDTRPLGDRFAEAVAEVLAGNGFQVQLTQTPMPTPAISFAIRELKQQGGIAVTASHNPFTYNGLKFKPSYAGPAEPEMTQWIEGRLFKNPVKQVKLEEGLHSGKIRWIDLKPRYLKFLKSYVEWPVLRKAGFKVAYDSMHGAGQELLQEVTSDTRLRILPVRLAGELFRSSYRPEPVGEHLKELSALVKKQKCHLGLANDGDADRLGLVGPDGQFVSAQETMGLLLWHLLEDRGWRGRVVSTVSSTNLLDKMAAHYKVPFTRTPVGFKHIARLMRESQVLFGGEESGGFGFKGCVPERDGLLAGLLVLEMMAMRRRSLTKILQEMRARFGSWIFERSDLEPEKPLPSAKLLEWAGSTQRNPSPRPLPFGGRERVREISTVDGVKVIFKDGSWLLLRASGTEPLLRVYVEGRNKPTVHALLKAGEGIGRQVTQ
jgi:alpha-D-glucose phosphate-specific phosphoglucomutase